MPSLTDYLLREYIQGKNDTIAQQTKLIDEDRAFRMRQEELGQQVMADSVRNFMQVQSQDFLRQRQSDAVAMKGAKAATEAGVDPSSVDVRNPVAVGALEGQATIAEEGRKQKRIDVYNDEKFKRAYENADKLAQTKHQYRMAEIEAQTQGQGRTPGRTPDQADIERTRKGEAAKQTFDKDFYNQRRILTDIAENRDGSAPPSRVAEAKAKLRYLDEQRAQITDNASYKAVKDKTDLDNAGSDVHNDAARQYNEMFNQ